MQAMMKQGFWVGLRQHAAWTSIAVAGHDEPRTSTDRDTQTGTACVLPQCAARRVFSRCHYPTGPGSAQTGTRKPLRDPPGPRHRPARQRRVHLVHKRPVQTPPAATETWCAGRPTSAGPGYATLTPTKPLGSAGPAPARPRSTSATPSARGAAAGCCCAAARTPATSTAAAGPRAPVAAAGALRGACHLREDAALYDHTATDILPRRQTENKPVASWYNEQATSRLVRLSVCFAAQWRAMRAANELKFYRGWQHSP